MLFFLRMGLTNARRSAAQSILAVISISLAAAFMTHAISLGRGYAQGYKASYRSQLGGEVVVYAHSFTPNFTSSNDNWHYKLLPQAPLSSLEIFYPEVLSQGYLHQLDNSPLNEPTLDALRSMKNIAEVYPRYQIPVVVTDLSGKQHVRMLRGRDANVDRLLHRHPEQMLSAGRWFYANEEAPVGVVSGNRFDSLNGYVVGSILSVKVPQVTRRDNTYTFDFSNAHDLDISLVGSLSIVTRRIDTRVLTWNLEEIQVPLAAWENIWHSVANGVEYIPEEVVLLVDNLPYVEDVVVDVRNTFPEYTVTSVPQLAMKAETEGLIEGQIEQRDRSLAELEDAWLHEKISFDEYVERLRAIELAMSQLGYRQNETQQGMPSDLRLPLGLLVCANAALVVAAHMLILISERTKEIGILKALGTREIEVVMMALGEATFLTLLGSAIGFVFVRLPAVFNQLVRNTAPEALLHGVAQDAAIVFAAALLGTIAFALVPAWRMARLSAMESLRREQGI